MNSYDDGFHACEDEYLAPLQSRLQEFLLKHQELEASVKMELYDMLRKSDFRSQWKTA